MSLPTDDERRPRQDAAANLKCTSYVSDSRALARRPEFAVRVVTECSNGVIRTYLVTNLPAAERRVRKVRDAGRFATLSLVRLVPVPHAELEDVDPFGALLGGEGR